MFFDCLDKVERGLCVCVFDGTDRLQHTFWRDTDDSHPARPGQPEGEPGRRSSRNLYRRMDDLVGRTMAKCRRRGRSADDHFRSWLQQFRRGVDLNRWLEENGYLTATKPAVRSTWPASTGSKTRGLRHRPGRHLHQPGQVLPGHRCACHRGRSPREEIAARPSALSNPEHDAVRREAGLYRDEVL